MRRAVGGALLAFAVTSCVGARPYRPPTAEQPHAVVKLRRSYDAVAGVGLVEYADVVGHDEATTGRAFAGRVEASLGSTPRTDAVLLYPEQPLELAIGSGFFHMESRQVQESYTVQTPYTSMESYDCSFGYGGTANYRTCQRQVTAYRTETRYRTVTKAVEVGDGECKSAVRFRPRAGRVYLIDYTYRAPGSCNITCVEQEILPGEGSFHAVPCAR
jgi:hypothetical protein